MSLISGYAVSNGACEISFQSIIFCTVSNGTREILFQFVFFVLFSMRRVKFHFQSEQITLNYIMLEPKIEFNNKKTKIYDFFQEAIKSSVPLMGHHSP